MTAPRFLSPKTLRGMLESSGLSLNEFNRMALNGLAPGPLFHAGPRMPRWLTVQVAEFLADLDAKTSPSKASK